MTATQRKIYRIIKYAVLFMLLILYISPLYIVFIISGKSDQEFLMSPLTFPNPIQFSNYVEAIKTSKYFNLFVNSVKIALVAVVLIVFISALAAYPIARRNRRVYHALYLYFVAGIIVPFQLIMIPLYRFIKELGLINTHLGVILINVGIGLPFVIFFYVGFLKTIPKAFDEAAIIDGASQFTIFWRIILPLMRPAIGTIAVIQTIWIWNGLLIPLLFLYKYEKMTVIIGIYSFVGERGARWNMIFALILVSIIPIILIFIFFQKYIIKSYVAGGLKG
jgi:raffinose/stachyose/melibiose transport system permease protein